MAFLLVRWHIEVGVSVLPNWPDPGLRLRAGHGLGYRGTQCDRQVRGTVQPLQLRSYAPICTLTSENISSDHGISETQASGADGARAPVSGQGVPVRPPRVDGQAARGLVPQRPAVRQERYKTENPKPASQSRGMT